ncbi:butyrophilin subfamily 2 member A2-like isoform X1 [Seriola lalandi dorsalis]|uniref:butyrophilin subfamily 2 member A2-like isoform X1 n=1 Tax=Seriola lalandi dorsalis TaxID=1841481 RepID=UPI000C6FCC23|nr:butyrophilin subfamily 2 member A2-like isoform X1 [Seriola lalandi dorsalis]
MVSQRTSTLLLAFVCLLSSAGTTWGHGHGMGVIKVVAEEGNDAILPCSPSTKENIESKLFDWKKDGQMEVFMYDAGIHYNNDLSGQDEQFSGRISHFQEQLKYGNASIIIRNTTMADSGDYTCAFPHLKPGGEIYNIQLVVQLTFKDRASVIRGASPKPYVSIYDVTDDGVQLKCEVQGVFPEPTLQWQDSDGKVLPAEEPQVSERAGRYSITLQTTVTSIATNRFHCVAKQDNIGHVVNAEIIVPKKLFEDQYTSGFIAGWFSGVLTVAAPLAVFLLVKYILNLRKKGADQQSSSSSSSAEPLKSNHSNHVC